MLNAQNIIPVQIAMFVRLAFFYSEKEESRESEAVINAFDSRSENR